MPNEQDKNKADSQVRPGRSSWFSTAAALSNVIGPVLGTVSTAAGYSWRVNVAGTMVGSSIAGIFGFAGSAFGFWGAHNDYVDLRNGIAEEVAGMPLIYGSGFDSVLCVTQKENIDEDGCYLFKDEDEAISAIIVKDGMSEEFELNDYNHPWQHLLLPLIQWPEKDSGKIDGDLGLALVNLIENLEPKLKSILVPIMPITPEQTSYLRKFIYGAHTLVTLGATGCCIAETAAYGWVSSQTNAEPTDISQGYVDTSDKYADPVFPEWYISTSLFIKTIAVLSAAGITFYQNQREKKLTEEHSNRRIDRDAKQAIANQKESIEKIKICFFSYIERLHNVNQSCRQLLEVSNDIREKSLILLLRDYLKSAQGIFHSLKNEPKLQPIGVGDIREKALIIIESIEHQIGLLLEKINQGTIKPKEALGKDIPQLLENASIQLVEAFRLLILSGNLFEKINSDNAVEINDSRSSLRFGGN